MSSRYIAVFASIMAVCLAAIMFSGLSDAADDVQYDDYGAYWGYTIGFAFTGEGATGGVEWTFSDEPSNTITGYSCQHRFPSIGNYTVTMKSINSGPDGVSGTSDDLTTTTVYTIEIKGYPYIDYDSNGGSEVPRTQQTLAGVPASKPADPEKTGSVFAGWYTDQSLTEQYNWSSNVMAPMTLYAKWVESSAVTYNVTFVTNGGSSVPAQSITEGGSASKPADPTRNGYVFSGWFSDQSLTTVYVWSSPITSNTTVYAGWTAQSITAYRVTFSTGEIVNIVSGMTVSRPADPVRDGFEFGGWFSDDDCTEEYDFSSPVTKNTEIYAKWTSVEEEKNESTFVKDYFWIIPAIICAVLLVVYLFSVSRSPVILILACIAAVVAIAFYTGAITYEQITGLFGGKA